MALSNSQRDKQFVAGTSVFAAVFLTAIKIAVGLLTGSLGVLAEAAHSGLDLVAALITFFAVRVSDRAPDADHQYGHGKIENLSALAETFLLFVTCGWIVYEAVERIFFRPRPIDPSIWAFATMAVSIVVDFSRSRALARVAKKYQSPALEADARHFQTDIWSSLVVIAGLAFARFGFGGGRADAVAALIVALIVIYVSWQLARRTVDALLDTAPAGLAGKITDAAAKVPGVCRVLRARVRGSGNHIFADLHVAVPRHYSLQDSHDVAHRVEDAVRAVATGADVLVDTEPSAENENALERIHAVADRGHFSVHHITAQQTPRGMYVDLDLEVEPSLNFERAHAQASQLEDQLASEFGELADINVHIEPRDKDTLDAVELSADEARPYVERIKKTCKEFDAVRQVQDVRLQRMPAGVCLSLHALMDANRSVTEVHAVAEQLEVRLRRALPDLCRVLIHTEPFSRD
jgi:cation diffusion facilitator family transporter